MPKISLLPRPSPQFGQVVLLFLDVKNDVFAHITEPSNDDYGNDVSDNCDNNFGTFDAFGVKNDQKVSQYMILMSKYKGQHGGKKGQKIWAIPPSLFRKCPKENGLSYKRCSLMVMMLSRCNCWNANWEEVKVMINVFPLFVHSPQHK